MHTADQELRSRLNAETGKLAWKELERHFARGVVIKVAAELDLIEIATSMSKDDKDTIEQLIRAGKISRTSMDDAEDWNTRAAVFWAVVVAPWVLVQETTLPVSHLWTPPVLQGED